MWNTRLEHKREKANVPKVVFFFRLKGVHLVEPGWGIWEHFQSDDLSVALAADALPSTPPLSMFADEVETDDEIDSRFSSISYSKGGSLLRMLREHLDSLLPGSFAAGLQSYIRNNRFRNADSSMFFDEVKR